MPSHSQVLYIAVTLAQNTEIWSQNLWHYSENLKNNCNLTQVQENSNINGQENITKYWSDLYWF